MPQMLVAAEAFEAASAILTADLVHKARKKISKGRILIHTVKGDVHDIGKNIVKAFLSSGGFEVYDLGRDVSAREVIAKAQLYHVDIIAGSALMTTTRRLRKSSLIC